MTFPIILWRDEKGSDFRVETSKVVGQPRKATPAEEITEVEGIWCSFGKIKFVHRSGSTLLFSLRNVLGLIRPSLLRQLSSTSKSSLWRGKLPNFASLLSGSSLSTTSVNSPFSIK